MGMFKSATTDPKLIKFEMHPKPLKEDGSGFSTYKPAPDKRLVVTDPETNEVVGELFVPTDFCPGASCPYGKSSKHMHSYYNMYTESGNRRWVHVYCDRPTLAWWKGTFRDLVSMLIESPEWEKVEMEEETHSLEPLSSD